jgi:hypothetical protein
MQKCFWASRQTSFEITSQLLEAISTELKLRTDVGGYEPSQGPSEQAHPCSRQFFLFLDISSQAPGKVNQAWFVVGGQT